MKMPSKTLLKKYSWLRHYSKNVEDYINPKYYDNLIKEYSFNGLSDLDFFRKCIDSKLKNRRNAVVLELGCGSGRASSVFLKYGAGFKSFDMVDLSRQMLAFSRRKFSSYGGLNFFNQDSIDFLKKTKKKYDFVFSLWSLSHSIHEHMSSEGIERASVGMKKIITDFIEKKLTKNGVFFLIHFDSLSDEQKIIKRQEAKSSPVYLQLTKQSYSRRLIDQVLINLLKRRIITYTCKHYIGDPIRYSSLNEALEVFMNFHMETYFNRNDDVKVIISEIIDDLVPFQKRSGLYVPTGCFIYTLQKTT
jgi:SAM-dependent methyltransferase